MLVLFQLEQRVESLKNIVLNFQKSMVVDEDSSSQPKTASPLTEDPAQKPKVLVAKKVRTSSFHFLIV